MITGLSEMLRGCKRIAMNYSPNCAIPYVSRVDGGTLELIRSFGVEVVTAADLIQRFEAALTPAQLAGHRRAVAHLRQIVDETFSEIAHRVRTQLSCTEYSIQQFVLERITAHGLRTDEAPLVAVNANAANPHFSPSAERDASIGRNDLVLLDLFAKELLSDSIYGDLTWMAYVGDSVPREYAEVFALVACARDAAVKLIHSRVAQGLPDQRSSSRSRGARDNRIRRLRRSLRPSYRSFNRSRGPWNRSESRFARNPRSSRTNRTHLLLSRTRHLSAGTVRDSQ